jgi:type II secretory pathway predicted ATPase ExeA
VGRSRWPGFAEHHRRGTPGLAVGRKLHQLVHVRAGGVLHGPHGVGKTFLLHRFCQSLPPKEYRSLRLCHSSLLGGDLLRALMRLGGKTPQYRRGDNVAGLAALWQEWAPVWPVLLVEEAQDLNATALEELRLLTCARADTQCPFSLVLCGDDDLLPRLEMGVHRALLSRLGFCLRLERWDKESLRQYLQQRLAEVGIHASPLEAAAEELLLQSAQGTPRSLNALLQRAMESAALDKRRAITAPDVQSALDTLPWMARPRPQ